MVTLKSRQLSIFTEKDEQQNSRIKDKPRIPLNLASPWKILIVDDEIGIHEMTKLALNNFTFKRKNLTFLSAYSVQDAKAIIKTHPDIALMFLDLRIETDSSGLEVVEYIRKGLNNQQVRIVMRAGQSNIIDEDIVQINYDINDYKIKTEMIVDKLTFIAFHALKTYQQKANQQ